MTKRGAPLLDESHLVRTSTIALLGVPLELGASRRGARLGPQALRAAGLGRQLQELGYNVADAGDLPIIQKAGDVVGGPGHPKNVSAIREITRVIADAVELTMNGGSFPVVLGGDHSMAVGILAGIARVNGPQGVIWIDAHGDLNTTASSPTGNIHGMSMAAAFGRVTDIFPASEFPTPSADLQRSVFIALRELDPEEKRMLVDESIAHYTMSDIDRLGMGIIMERAIEHANGGPRSAHISFDIDAIDPTIAPGTGTPVPGGITYREAHLAMELLFESGIAHSLEMSEVNPLLDEHSVTAKLANELICSALGKRIL